MLSRIAKQLAEEALVGLGGLAVAAAIKHAPKAAKAFKDAAAEHGPGVIDAAKEKTNNAVETTKAVSSLAANAVKNKFKGPKN